MLRASIRPVAQLLTATAVSVLFFRGGEWPITVWLIFLMGVAGAIIADHQLQRGDTSLNWAWARMVAWVVTLMIALLISVVLSASEAP